MNKKGGFFAYIFWIIIGFVLGCAFWANVICK